jgi:hypothetical protein
MLFNYDVVTVSRMLQTLFRVESVFNSRAAVTETHVLVHKLPGTTRKLLKMLERL